MTAGSIHHVGVAVADLEAAITTYVDRFDAVVEHRGELASQGVRAASLALADGARIELLAPLAEDTPVGRFLRKRGEGMHHIAIEVEDVAATLRRQAERGAQLIDEEPRPGLFGYIVGFVHPDATRGVLYEFIQRAEGDRCV